MVKYTLCLHHGYLHQGQDFFFDLEIDVEMPVFPRKEESIFIGNIHNNGDYCTIDEVWHHPATKRVIAEVKLLEDQLWLAVAAWKDIPGEKRLVGHTKGVKAKFLHFVEHPDEL